MVKNEERLDGGPMANLAIPNSHPTSIPSKEIPQTKTETRGFFLVNPHRAKSSAMTTKIVSIIHSVWETNRLTKDWKVLVA
jgi:hypothetical protein